MVTAEVVFGVVVPLGVIQNGRNLPAHVELDGLRLQRNSRVTSLPRFSTPVKSSSHLVNGLDEEVVEEVPLLVRDPLRNNPDERERRRWLAATR